MREMEKKKLGFQTAIFSFLQRWKHLEALLDLSPNTPKTEMLSSEKCEKNPMREKLKGIDLNYEGKKLEEMMEIIESFDSEKLKNVDEQIKATHPLIICDLIIPNKYHPLFIHKTNHNFLC